MGEIMRKRQRSYIRTDEATGAHVRLCTKCLTELPIGDFYVRGSGKVDATCKRCNRRYCAERRRLNPDLYARFDRESRQRNAITQKAQRDRYRREHYDYFLQKSAERRASQKRSPQVAQVSRKAIITRDRRACYLCGDVLDPMHKRPHPKAITLDHVVPLSRGGAHTADNLRVACYSCNMRKNTKMLCELDWYRPVISDCRSG